MRTLFGLPLFIVSFVGLLLTTTAWADIEHPSPATLELKDGQRFDYWHAARVEVKNGDPLLVGFNSMPFDSTHGVAILEPLVKFVENRGDGRHLNPKRLEVFGPAFASLTDMAPALIYRNGRFMAFGTSVTPAGPERISFYDWETHARRDVSATNGLSVLPLFGTGDGTPSQAASFYVDDASKNQIASQAQIAAPSSQQKHARRLMQVAGACFVVAGALGFMSASDQIEDINDFNDQSDIKLDAGPAKRQRVMWGLITAGGMALVAN
ncbi:MAG: hypothetical protein R3E97_00030 [Candidatus Eisenbacteria bacterium]